MLLDCPKFLLTLVKAFESDQWSVVGPLSPDSYPKYKMQKLVTTSITWDMNTMDVVGGKPNMAILEWEYRFYSGPWAYVKGDSTLKAGEAAQAAFTQQLQQIFTAQYGSQKAILDYLNPVLKGIVSNPQGLSEKDLTAMRTNASDTIAQQGSHVRAAVAASEASHGSTGLPSGVQAQIDSGIAVAQGQQQASSQNQITQYNEDVRQKNFWNAVGGLSGNAQIINPQSYAGEANAGSNSLAGLGQAYYQSQQSGWLNAALGAVGGVAGQWASGGFKH